jgi:peroxiredoxin
MCVVCGITLAGLALTRLGSHPTPTTHVGVNEPAPDFTQPVAGQDGTSFALRSSRGRPVLLSFLDTQAVATAAGDPSRAQVVFLKSMERQNQAHGLRTVILDGASVVGKARPSPQALRNYVYDQSLPSSVLVLGDRGGAIAKAYGVTSVPTTFLIDRCGVVERRWDRFVSAAELDLVIGPLVGRSASVNPTPPPSGPADAGGACNR